MNFDYFFEIILEFEEFSKDRQVTEGYILNNITYGLKSLFGEVGASYPIQILKVEKLSGDKRFKIFLAGYRYLAVKIRASLSLQGVYHGDRCAYHISRAAENLLLLSDQKPEVTFE